MNHNIYHSKFVFLPKKDRNNIKSHNSRYNKKKIVDIQNLLYIINYNGWLSEYHPLFKKTIKQINQVNRVTSSINRTYFQLRDIFQQKSDQAGYQNNKKLFESLEFIYKKLDNFGMPYIKNDLGKLLNIIRVTEYKHNRVYMITQYQNWIKLYENINDYYYHPIKRTLSSSSSLKTFPDLQDLVLNMMRYKWIDNTYPLVKMYQTVLPEDGQSIQNIYNHFKELFLLKSKNYDFENNQNLYNTLDYIRVQFNFLNLHDLETEIAISLGMIMGINQDYNYLDDRIYLIKLYIHWSKILEIIIDIKEY